MRKSDDAGRNAAVVRFSAPQPRHKQAQKRINTHGRVPASRPQRATSVVFLSLLQSLSLSLCVSLCPSARRATRPFYGGLRPPASSVPLETATGSSAPSRTVSRFSSFCSPKDGQRILRPLMKGLGLFASPFPPGARKDLALSGRARRAPRFSAPSERAEGLRL